MFNPKKAIPKLVVGALALAGCATGDDGPNGAAGTGGMAGSGGTAGSGGSGGSGISANLSTALNAWCMKANECEYGGFDDQADCVNSVIEWYDLGPGVSSECEAAAISYFDCGAVLTCGEGSECDDEFDLLERACLEE